VALGERGDVVQGVPRWLAGLVVARYQLHGQQPGHVPAVLPGIGGERVWRERAVGAVVRDGGCRSSVSGAAAGDTGLRVSLGDVVVGERGDVVQGVPGWFAGLVAERDELHGQ